MTRRKSPNKELYDIVEWENPFDYNESSNIDVEVAEWMCKYDIYTCNLQERGGMTHFTLLVEAKTMETLLEVGYVIINSYGMWNSILDDNISIIHPETNKKIKPIKLFGSL